MGEIAGFWLHESDDGVPTSLSDMKVILPQEPAP